MTRWSPNPARRAPWRKRANGRRRQIAYGALLAGLTLLVLARREASPMIVVDPAPPFQEDGVEPAGSIQVPTGAEIPVQYVLRSGDTLSGLLTQLGLPPGEQPPVLEAVRDHLEVRRLRPGLAVTAYGGGNGRPHTLQFHVDGKGRLRLRATGEGWTRRWTPFVERVEVRRTEGVIDGSLVGALEAVGAPADVAYRMAEVFQWDVDFHRDLRAGDTFQVLYEDVYLDGRRYKTGQVLAAALVNRGRRLEGYHFEEGYYDAEGRPLRKMFLRSPLPFSRVTSRFSHRRFHPVLKRYRPHYGVDYGAPAGTPVRATASGVVAFAGWDQGGGRTVRIRHPNEFLTAYLHLSRFAAGIRAGKRVGQGDLVGYVGSTGLATASHLDYRVQRRGRWIDPLSIKGVPAEPIHRDRRGEYQAWREQLRASLEDGAPWADAPPAERIAVLEPSGGGPRPGR